MGLRGGKVSPAEVCRGRARHDKRDAMKKAEAHREMQRQMHRGRD